MLQALRSVFAKWAMSAPVDPIALVKMSETQSLVRPFDTGASRYSAKFHSCFIPNNLKSSAALAGLRRSDATLESTSSCCRRKRTAVKDVVKERGGEKEVFRMRRVNH